VLKPKQEYNDDMERMAYSLLLKFNRVNGVNLRNTTTNNFYHNVSEANCSKLPVSKLSADELQQMT
jgi:hypothetical protein